LNSKQKSEGPTARPRTLVRHPWGSVKASKIYREIARLTERIDEALARFGGKTHLVAVAANPAHACRTWALMAAAWEIGSITPSEKAAAAAPRRKGPVIVDAFMLLFLVEC
jgi:hypothetical protein